MVEDRYHGTGNRDKLVEGRDRMFEDWDKILEDNDKWLDYSNDRRKSTNKIAAGTPVRKS